MNIEAIIRQLNLKNYALEPNTAVLTAEESAFLSIYEPDKAFIIYGTLGPNRPNHEVVADIPGTWHKVAIKGALLEEGWGAALGYPVFQPKADGWPIEAYVLRSLDLSKHWARLDAFEGEGYRRILSAFELKDGTKGVGHIYALNDTQI